MKKEDIGKMGSHILSPIIVSEKNIGRAVRMPFGDSILSSFNVSSIDTEGIMQSTPKPKDQPLTIDELMTQPLSMPMVTRRRRVALNKENAPKKIRKATEAAPVQRVQRDTRSSIAKVLREMSEQNPAVNKVTSQSQAQKKIATSGTAGVSKRRPIRSTARKPLAHVVRSDMHDSDWMSKQENTFIQILNWELRDFPVPFPDIGRLDALIARSNELRKDACQIYADMISVYKRLSEAIDFKKIRLHDDINLIQDLGKRAAFIDFLANYDSLSLCLGVEVITGMQIDERLDSNLTNIKAFIEETWFNNRHLEAKYMPENGPAATKRYTEALQKSLILRFLMLAYLLDQLKTKNVVDQCLFQISSPYKSTRDLVRSFSDTFLCGEGSVLRHLLHLGYGPLHEQVPFSEFDWRINRLATDLRDGIRLCGALKAMNGDDQILDDVRFPATARQVQLHNVGVAIEYCQRHGVLPLPPSAPLSAAARYNMITAADIVDGHREKTLSLLWKIIAHWKVRELVHERVLETELQRLGAEEEILPTSSVSPIASLLLQWAAIIAKIHRGPEVHTFAASFADCQAWCLLVHHYAPNIIKREDIKNPREYLNKVKRGEVDLAAGVPSSTTWFINTNEITDPHAEARKMARENFNLFNDALQQLGEVPPLLAVQDLNDIVDEKSVISILAYMFSRLVGDTGRSRSYARRIQDIVPVEIGTPMVARTAEV